MTLTEGKKVYFASDNHLGAPNLEDSLVREKKFVAWLDKVKEDAEAIILVGDVFDFWFEFSRVNTPQIYQDVFQELSKLKNSGVEIHYVAGNHDYWNFGHFEQELHVF